MSETRTTSILQRVPVILAVTAASYGLTLQDRGERRPQAARHGDRGRRHSRREPVAGKR